MHRSDESKDERVVHERAYSLLCKNVHPVEVARRTGLSLSLVVSYKHDGPPVIIPADSQPSKKVHKEQQTKTISTMTTQPLETTTEEASMVEEEAGVLSFANTTNAESVDSTLLLRSQEVIMDRIQNNVPSSSTTSPVLTSRIERTTIEELLTEPLVSKATITTRPRSPVSQPRPHRDVSKRHVKPILLRPPPRDKQETKQ